MTEDKTAHEIGVEKLKENPIIIEFSKFELVGGAVIDIISDRVPKDYDFDLSGGAEMLYAFNKLALEGGFVFDCKTNSAITFTRGNIIIQGLFRASEFFEFTISQARFSAGVLSIDYRSLSTKKLIPTDFSFKNPYNAFLRLPHWRRKGYELPDKTYFSLLSNYRKSFKRSAAEGETLES